MRTVTFPTIEPVWLEFRMSVQFYAIDGETVVNCLAPVEVLYDFGGLGPGRPTAEQSVRTFITHRQAIEDAARRKLMSRPAATQGEELILLPADFPPRSTTTTPHPPQPTSLHTSIDISHVNDATLLRGVTTANTIMSSEFGRSGPPVRADWRLISTPHGPNLAKLTITDEESGASAQGLYTALDLTNISALRFSLFRVWDDLFREKGRHLMATFQTTSAEE